MRLYLLPLLVSSFHISPITIKRNNSPIKLKDRLNKFESELKKSNVEECEDCVAGYKKLRPTTSTKNKLQKFNIIDESLSLNKYGEQSLSMGSASDENSRNIETKNMSVLSILEHPKFDISVAITSFVAAIGFYLYQFLHPVSAVALLNEMQLQSAPLIRIGTNHKPTVIEFWAPWCENCKMSAPSMYQIEQSNNQDVNFVMINANESRNMPLVEYFQIDAIPHLILLDSNGVVQTNLIGGMYPPQFVQSDLDVLIKDAKVKSSLPQNGVSENVKINLPFTMLDGYPNEGMKVSFDEKIQ